MIQKKVPDIVKKVFEIFGDNEIYLMGGAVRDMVMNVTPMDFDFATPLLPNEIKAVLKDYKCDMVGSAFGVVVTKIDGYEIEISTYRKHETYTTSRHPVVEYGTQLVEDIARRDFTCNSLAMDKNGTIIDYVHGIEDINHNRLEIFGSCEVKFHDDPLRMLRAIACVSRFGFFISARVRQAIKSHAVSISNISCERWKMEMDKILLGLYVGFALYDMIDTELAKYILPELLPLVNMTQPKVHHHKDVFKHTCMVIHNMTQDINLKWAGLLHDIGKAVTRSVSDDGVIHFYNHNKVSALLARGILARFRFSKTARNRILFVVENHMRLVSYDDDWHDRAIRRLAVQCGDYLPDLLHISRADITSSRPDKVKRELDAMDVLEARIKELKERKELVPVLPKNIGTYIMDLLGISPSIKVGITKKYLEGEIEAGTLQSNQPYEYYKDTIIKFGENL